MHSYTVNVNKHAFLRTTEILCLNSTLRTKPYTHYDSSRQNNKTNVLSLKFTTLPLIGKMLKSENVIICAHRHSVTDIRFTFTFMSKLPSAASACRIDT